MAFHDIKEGGKKYQFTKDHTQDKPYLISPDVYRKGDIIQERKDGWFQMNKSVSCHPSIVETLIRKKTLIECQ